MAEVDTSLTKPAQKTIIVQTAPPPPLIPDENATAWCFTRRNIFDAVIALGIAGAIIYFVMSMRSGRGGLSQTLGYGAPPPQMRGYQAPQRGEFGDMGRQIAGAIKKLFK